MADKLSQIIIDNDINFKETFRVFESVQDYVKTCDKETIGSERNVKASPWYGNKSWKEALALTKSGDLSAVEEANAILDRVDGQINSQGMRPQWDTQPAGAFPNVGAFMAGQPETMYCMRNMRGQKRAVNIYYAPVVSQGISHEEIFKRGVTVLALAMQLGRICDVNIYFITAYEVHNHIIKLAQPMVLSEASHILTSTPFLRHISYGLATSHGSRGSWANWFNIDNKERNIKEYKKRLNLTDNDIIIPPVHMEEYRRGELKDPVKYINDMMEKYR